VRKTTMIVALARMARDNQDETGAEIRMRLGPVVG
jgi:hypothetical protein